jgi:hypothetical protein
MAELHTYQDVVLLRDIPEEGLCAGDVGTMVDRRRPWSRNRLQCGVFDMLG